MAMTDIHELLELMHDISVQLGGDGAVTIKRLSGEYAPIPSPGSPRVLRYEVFCPVGGASRGSTITQAMLDVLSVMEESLKSKQAEIANNLHTVDRLLSAIDSLKGN